MPSIQPLTSPLQSHVNVPVDGLLRNANSPPSAEVAAAGRRSFLLRRTGVMEPAAANSGAIAMGRPNDDLKVAIMKIEDALVDVEIAFRQIEFAIKLLSFCELGNISPADFDTDHFVLLGNERLNFPSGKFNDGDSLIKAAGTSVLIAFSSSVLALDDAFQTAGMKPSPEAAGNDEQLRTLVYMARCAVAHGIADPRWEVRGPYARTLSVNLGGTTISIDLSSLHGQTFVVDQLGGYANWYRIRDAAVRLLEPARP